MTFVRNGPMTQTFFKCVCTTDKAGLVALIQTLKENGGKIGTLENKDAPENDNTKVYLEWAKSQNRLFVDTWEADCVLVPEEFYKQ